MRHSFQRLAISFRWFLALVFPLVLRRKAATVTEISPQTAHSTAWCLLKARGSKSTWMTGFLGVIPVCLEKEAAEDDHQVAFIHKPGSDWAYRFCPGRRRPAGWLSGIWPLPLKVVTIGQSRLSASRMIAVMLKRAP